MIDDYLFCILIDEILHTNKKLFDMVYWQFIFLSLYTFVTENLFGSFDD